MFGTDKAQKRKLRDFASRCAALSLAQQRADSAIAELGELIARNGHIENSTRAIHAITRAKNALADLQSSFKSFGAPVIASTDEFQAHCATVMKVLEA